ncbi:hypothetical protein [Comamonas sp. lk]|uniref:hypothetical protein n=1 Tax=Comamonas sp. lk TaxID=2201272 RepID=UPI000EACC9EF|nr:hypothetical protein [Comamonas sp. lk]
MKSAARPPYSALRPIAVALLSASLLAAAPSSYAFWGLLGKAGKAAATAGKAGGAAKVGAAGAVAVGGAELAGAGLSAAARSAVFAADDAARLAGKAPLADMAHAGHMAMPAEVASYLSRPAAALTTGDTAQMMKVYQDLMHQAGKSGDFTVIERMPQLHGAKTLDAAPAANAGQTVAASAPAASKVSISNAELSFHALRLLAHAAGAGDRNARKELQRRCQAPAPQGQEAEHAALCRSAPKTS